MPRVLCIEGDADTRASLRRLLEADGFAVDESATGLAGIERARIVPPDLVLADMRLPDIDGQELASRFKQEKRLARVPCVLLADRGAHRDEAVAAGGAGSIQKPVDPQTFGAEVRAFLEGKRETLTAEGERAALEAYSARLAQKLELTVAELTRANARLVEADQLKSAFMRNLAHELGTPLTPLAGYLKILRSEKLGQLSDQQKKICDAMLLGASRLAHIIENLSDFAHLEDGPAALERAPVDVSALAQEVVDELRPVSRERRLHFGLERPPAPIVANVDGRKIKQAVANLAANAVKFSPHGSEVLIQLALEGGKLRVAVYDQGPGVPAAEQPRLFEPFYEAGRPDATNPGSGLGLPVARRIVEAHGGRIWVESPPLELPSTAGHHFNGARFVFEVPAV